MTNNFYEQAATELLSRRVAGTKAPRLDEQLRPTNIEDALNIQSAMVSIHSDKVAGWKCLLPRSEKIIVAPIFSGTIQRGDNCTLFADNGVVRIEPEIAFILAKDLPANSEGYTEAQIDAAIGASHMALELMQIRFADDSGADFNEKLADGLNNQGIFIGPEIDREKAIAAANVTIEVSQVDKVQKFDGKHPDSAPFNSVYWLINYMTARGISFSAGETIITGSYCGIVDVAFDKLTTVNYVDIGQYQVTFNAK